MKKPNYLKGLRVVLAILIFVPILLFFVDFADVLPDNLHTLLHLQIMPAILGGMAGLVVFQFVLALLFGRIYCSVICPAGVLQDIINRVFCIGKKKKKGVRRFSYHKPMNILRYSILGLTFVLAVFGKMCIRDRIWIPGRRYRWYVFPKMICALVSSFSSVICTPFTVPCVPTGIKIGVSITP